MIHFSGTNPNAESRPTPVQPGQIWPQPEPVKTEPSPAVYDQFAPVEAPEKLESQSGIPVQKTGKKPAGLNETAEAGASDTMLQNVYKFLGLKSKLKKMGEEHAKKEETLPKNIKSPILEKHEKPETLEILQSKLQSYEAKPVKLFETLFNHLPESESEWGLLSDLSTICETNAASKPGSALDPLPRQDASGRELTAEQKETLSMLRIRHGVVTNKFLQNLDLSGLDLRGLDFTGVQLHYCNLDNADLEGAKFQNACISNGSLRNVNLKQADFQKARIMMLAMDRSDCTGANFTNARLQDLTLDGTDFSNASFRRATLLGNHNTSDYLDCTRALWTGANLEGVRMTCANLQGMDLSGMNLSRADIRTSSLSGSNLEKVNLTGTTLNRVDLNDTNLKGANLKQASLKECASSNTDFSGADLSFAQISSHLQKPKLNGANLERASFHHPMLDAEITGARFLGARLQGCNFKGQDLSGVDFTGCQLPATDFTDCKLDGTNFSRVNLEGADFTGSNFRAALLDKQTILGSANLTGQDLSGIDFSNMQLAYANLTDAKIEGTNFSEAQLEGIKLRGTKLKSAILGAGTNLSHTDFSGLDLSGMDFSGCQLAYAVLEGANLAGTRLNGASLHKANLKGSNFRQAVFDKTTNLQNAIMDGLDLSELNLSGMDLQRATFIGANLQNTNLHGTDLTAANLSQSSIGLARLDPETRLQSAILQKCNLAGMDLSGRELKDVQFDESDLKGVNFSNSNLTGSIFKQATNFNRTVLKDAKVQGICLSEQDLSGIDLSGLDLTGASFVKSNLTGAVFKGANLYQANLSGAHLQRATLDNACLEKANLEGVNLAGKNLSGLNMAGANLRDAILSRAILDKTNLLSADLSRVQAHRTSFREADLSGACLDEAILHKTIFKKANLNNASLDQSGLKGTDFSDAEMHGTLLTRTYLGAAIWQGADTGSLSLEGSDLRRVNPKSLNFEDASLAGSNMQGMDLRGCVLKGANLRGANLVGARLHKVDLSGLAMDRADLSHADLTEAILLKASLRGTQFRKANLTKADLGGASLHKADLTGATLDQIKMERAKISRTLLPEDFDPLAHGAVYARLSSETPVSGMVRQAGELTREDVLETLEERLMVITMDDIEQLLSEIPQADRGKILLAMQGMSQFGNMESFNTLAQVLSDEQHKDHPLVSDYDGTSLGSNLMYLNRKGSFSYNVKNIDRKGLPDKGALMLDELLLQRLESDPDFCKHILKKDIRLYSPAGWINGINPFNHLDLQQVLALAKDVHQRAQAIQAERGVNLRDALDLALELPIRERLEKCGLGDRLEMLHNDSVWPATLQKTDANQIASVLRPHRMTTEQLDMVLSRFSEESHQNILEYVVQSLQVFSPRRLAGMAAQHYARLRQMASDRKIPESKIFFYVPENQKSYGMVTMIYAMVNHIPYNRIITTQDVLTKTCKSNDNAMIVTLDDIAGSGSSLKYSTSEARKIAGKNHFVIAPFITAPQGQKSLQKEAGRNVSLVTGMAIPNFSDSAYYRSLSKKDQAGFDLIIGNSGFGSNDISVVFPYMAPDNNNNIAGYFHKFFLLNGKGAKNTTHDVEGKK